MQERYHKKLLFLTYFTNISIKYVSSVITIAKVEKKKKKKCKFQLKKIMIFFKTI